MTLDYDEYSAVPTGAWQINLVNRNLSTVNSTTESPVASLPPAPLSPDETPQFSSHHSWQQHGTQLLALFLSLLTVLCGGATLTAMSLEQGIDPALAERMNQSQSNLPLLVAEPFSALADEAAVEQAIAALSDITSVERVIPQYIAHLSTDTSGSLDTPIPVTLFSQVPGLSPAPAEAQNPARVIQRGEVMLPRDTVALATNEPSNRLKLSLLLEDDRPVELTPIESLPFISPYPPNEIVGYAHADDIREWFRTTSTRASTIEQRYLLQLSDPLARGDVIDQVENLGFASFGQEQVVRPPYERKTEGLGEWKLVLLATTAGLAFATGVSSFFLFHRSMHRRRFTIIHAFSLTVVTGCLGVVATTILVRYFGGEDFLWLPVPNAFPQLNLENLASALAVLIVVALGFSSGIVLLRRALKPLP